ncbi:hypothetical protein KIW84_061080 [Lathyrus oleraceus]|uniref:Uncharacterized protein n=1 Tax=Pisum sativum TaxID=3888 RepID=A0A9D4W1E5_PEA|nr:hypothetical protein KIW84_061080 [Pisum sativum]
MYGDERQKPLENLVSPAAGSRMLPNVCSGLDEDDRLAQVPPSVSEAWPLLSPLQGKKGVIGEANDVFRTLRRDGPSPRDGHRIKRLQMIEGMKDFSPSSGGLIIQISVSSESDESSDDSSDFHSEWKEEKEEVATTMKGDNLGFPIRSGVGARKLNHMAKNRDLVVFKKGDGDLSQEKESFGTRKQMC